MSRKLPKHKRAVRRSVSFRGEFYERTQRWVDENESISLSNFIEKVIGKYLDEAGAAPLTREEWLKEREEAFKALPEPSKDEPTTEEIISQHFTF